MLVCGQLLQIVPLNLPLQVAHSMTSSNKLGNACVYACVKMQVNNHSEDAIIIIMH